MQDVAAVLTADQIDVVDPQIGGDLLVGGRAVRALPFDQPWWATAQALVTASKDASVVPCGGENIGVLLGGECLVESVINDVIDVGDEPGPRRANAATRMRVRSHTLSVARPKPLAVESNHRPQRRRHRR